MRASAALFLGLAACASCSTLVQDLTASDSDRESETPIVRVVHLLQDLAAERDAEAAKSDQDLYDKLACWCWTNDKGKTKTSDGNDLSASLTASIEKNTALASTR